MQTALRKISTIHLKRWYRHPTLPYGAIHVLFYYPPCFLCTAFNFHMLYLIKYLAFLPSCTVICLATQCNRVAITKFENRFIIAVLTEPKTEHRGSGSGRRFARSDWLAFVNLILYFCQIKNINMAW